VDAVCLLGRMRRSTTLPANAGGTAAAAASSHPAGSAAAQSVVSPTSGSGSQNDGMEDVKSVLIADDSGGQLASATSESSDKTPASTKPKVVRSVNTYMRLLTRSKSLESELPKTTQRARPVRLLELRSRRIRGALLWCTVSVCVAAHRSPHQRRRRASETVFHSAAQLLDIGRGRVRVRFRHCVI
jgi:hypothetical protein